MSDEIKNVEDKAPKAELSAELPEPVLDQVVGGKTPIKDILIVKNVDKSSPDLF